MIQTNAGEMSEDSLQAKLMAFMYYIILLIFRLIDLEAFLTHTFIKIVFNII